MNVCKCAVRAGVIRISSGFDILSTSLVNTNAVLAAVSKSRMFCSGLEFA